MALGWWASHGRFWGGDVDVVAVVVLRYLGGTRWHFGVEGRLGFGMVPGFAGYRAGEEDLELFS